MNKVVDVKSINKMMADFERENMKKEFMQEIMGDAMDDAMEEDGDEDEEDKIVSQVLDEIGISFGEEVPDAPTLGTGIGAGGMGNTAGGGKVAEAAGGGGGGDSALSELEERLNNLKR